MSTADLCQVCESEMARHTCDQCGAAVCDDHYDRSTALCASCASRVGDDPDAPGSGGAGPGSGDDAPGSDDAGPEGSDGWT